MKLSLALFCFVALLQSQPPSPTPAKTGQNQKEQRDSKTTKGDRPQTAQPTTPAFVQGKTEYHKSQSEQKSTPDWWIISLTAALVLLAGAQFWAMHRQADYMRRGLRISIRQTRIALRGATAAKESAEAAVTGAEASRQGVERMKEANQINRESLQAVQRAYAQFPYVAKENVNVARLLDASTGNTAGWRFYLPLDNTGNTPAYDLRVHVNFTNVDGTDGLPGDFTYPDYGSTDEPQPPLTIGAKARIYSSPLDISHAIMRKLQLKESRLFFYGWANYRDVFEGTTIHRSEFCYELRINQIAGNELAFETISYGNHNSYT